MRLFCILLGITLMFVGSVFWKGRGVEWIKAWRETEEEQKRQIHIEALGKNVALVFGSVGILFALAGISEPFKEHIWIYSMIGWLILTGLDIYYIEKSERYKVGTHER